MSHGQGAMHHTRWSDKKLAPERCDCHCEGNRNMSSVKSECERCTFQMIYSQSSRGDRQACACEIEGCPQKRRLCLGGVGTGRMKGDCVCAKRGARRKMQAAERARRAIGNVTKSSMSGRRWRDTHRCGHGHWMGHVRDAALHQCEDSRHR